MPQVSDQELSILHNPILALSGYIRQIKTPAAQQIVRMGGEAEKIVSSKMVKPNAPLGASSFIISTNKNLFEMFGISHRIR